MDLKEIERVIENTSEEKQKKIDWTKKYPVLTTYREKVKAAGYEDQLNEMMDRLKREHGYSDLDAMLVLKDILAHARDGGGFGQ